MWPSKESERDAHSSRRAVIAISAAWVFATLSAQESHAGIDDCVGAALAAASPADMERAAAFASTHASCLQDFVPPTLVPYVLLSGSVDTANSSGLLAKPEINLAFGKSYSMCVAKLDPGKTAVKKLAPILKPICNKSGISAFLKCSDLEGKAAEEANANIAREIPILSLIPCACAAATSGLGVEKLKDLVEKTKSCGVAIAEVGKYLGKGAKGAYSAGKKLASKAGELGKQAGCQVVKLVGGGCSKAAPPSGAGEAEKFCKSQGSTVKAAMSKTNRPDDYSVTCINHAACIVQPGKAPACVTAAEFEEHQESKRSENEVRCNQNRDKLKVSYDQKCRDENCRTGVVLVAASYAAGCAKYANDSKDALGEPMFNDPSGWSEEAKFLASLDRLVAESVIRDPKAGRAEKLAAYGCKPFLGRDLEALCPKGDAYSACKRYVDVNELRLCLEVGNPNSKYVSKAVDDPGADIATRLRVNGCSAFLGRAGEWLCVEQKGLVLCNDAKSNGAAKACFNNESSKPAPSISVTGPVGRATRALAPR